MGPSEPEGPLPAGRLTLRPARDEDEAEVAALVERAYAKYVERMGRRPGPMDDDYGERIAAGRVTIAELDAELVGILVLVEEPDCLLVENVAVEPSSQGEGVGHALLGHAEEVARAAGLSRLRLYTHETMTENRALYPRLGYVEVEPPPDDEWNRVFFVKRLAP